MHRCRKSFAPSSTRGSPPGSRRVPTPPTGQEEIIGYHLEQAFLARAELGPVNAETRAVALRAGRLLGHTGRRALDRGEFLTASALLERACRLLLVEPTERSSLLCDLARALRGVGALEAADAALAEATEHARLHHDEATEYRAEVERAHIAFMRSPPDADALREIAQPGYHRIRRDRQRHRPRGCLAAHGCRRTGRAQARRAAHGAPEGS